ncbi:MAG TPA: gamma-glutamyl-gamma-aminobutyrate hydrolase family protein [Chitinophagaceae bacterium]
MKIGLTYTGSEEKHQNYIRWLMSSDDIEVITLSEGIDNNINGNFDGLVLSGGTDIHPKFYKSKKLEYPNVPSAFEEKRDEFEISVFRSAEKNNIPVLGVCRGFQLINCIFGGKLKQDIGDSLNKIHRAHVENKLQKDKAHGLSIEPGTLLKEICSAERLVVNSAHHQAVKKPGKGLRVNCMADDGTIEGVEWAHPSGKPFMLAVQWHPERMYKFQLEDSPVSKAIRDRFIEEVKKSIADKK